MKIRELETFAAIAGLMADGRPRTVNDIVVRTGLDAETVSEMAFLMTKTFNLLERSEAKDDVGTTWIYHAARELRKAAA